MLQVLQHAGGQNWCIGQEWDGGPKLSDFFSGGVDEVRFWDHARTAEQIKANFKSTVEPDAHGLVASYRFDAPHNSNARMYRQALDSVHNAHNGRIMGNFKWISSFAPIAGSDSAVRLAQEVYPNVIVERIAILVNGKKNKTTMMIMMMKLSKKV